MMKKKVRKNLRVLQPYLQVIGVYLLYLTTLPIVTKWLVPCLNYRPGTSYAYAECNSTVILDRFLVLALAGCAAVIVFTYYRFIRRKLLSLTVFAAVTAVITIGSYYLYLPMAMNSAANAPILLESLR